MKEGLKNMDALGNTTAEWTNAMNEIEHEPEPPAPMLEGMTNAELVAVILHDPDYWERRKALTIIRMREYRAGSQMAVATFERVAR